MEIRKVYAPYSKTGEQVGQTPLEGYVVNTGIVNENGEWIGIKSTDKQFRIDAKHEAIPNGAAVLSPQTDPQYIDMTGFVDLFVAFKVSNGGNFAIEAVMGPDTNSFANLNPVNPASRLMSNGYPQGAFHSDFEEIFNDSAQALTADVWNIFIITEVLKSQKLLQFKITNNSGGESNIELATMRVV